MYKKTKFLIYASAILLVVAIALSVTNLSSSIATKSDEKNNQSTLDDKKNLPIEQNEQTEIQVSDEVQKFMHPETDPLSQVDTESSQDYKQNNDTTNVPDAIQEIKTDSNEEKIQEKPMAKTGSLYFSDNNPANDYEVVASFSTENTSFYVITYKDPEIQTHQDFINKKYYIYKDQDGTLVRCFYLFDRAQRKSMPNKGLIDIKTEPGQVAITFNGINKVTRTVYNKQITSPYGISSEVPLHFEEKSTGNNGVSALSIPVKP